VDVTKGKTMTDHIARVREQAEKEARKLYARVPLSVSRYSKMDFRNGAVWLASRLTQEKIADTLANINNYGPERVTPGPLEHAAAAAILALLADDA
jgi:hypothetical protein